MKKLRRLPPLPGRENEAIMHFAADIKRSHLHAPRGFRNVRLHSPPTDAAAASTTVTAEMELL
jgi:hypothetical protein